MLRRQEFSDLIDTAHQNILSVFLDIDPTKPENQGTHPAYGIWLRNTLRDVTEGLPKESRREIGPVAGRVLEYVEEERIQGRGLVLFAGPGLWREFVLPFPLDNRLRYGRPDLVPLLWAIDEHDPYGILVVDREHARILVAYLAETAVLSEDDLHLDTSDWRFKAGRPPTYTKGTGTGATRGSQRDTFESRVGNWVRRFWQGAAEATAHWMQDLGLDRLIIAGPQEAATAVRDLLPEPAQGKVVGIVHLPSSADVHTIRERTLPVALEEEHRREAQLVAEVLDQAAARGGGVVGKGPTLGALIQEQVMTLVVDRDIEGAVWRCLRCGYVSGDVIERCPTCEGEVEEVALTQVLPLLARQSGARIELVGETAARGLAAHDGLGGLLRYVAGLHQG